MILAVLGATVILPGLRGYYLGLITGQGIVLIVLLVYVLRSTPLARSAFSPKLAREALAFGLPMATFELCSNLWHLGDRFLVQWVLDERAVGYYTMAYNLSMYVNALFTLPMDLAAVPLFTQIYESEGPGATSEFLRKGTRVFLLLAIPAVAGVTVLREDVVLLLASRQFLPGAELVPLVLAGLLVYGSRVLLGAGMILRKRPWLIAELEVAGAGLNLVLNLLLLPRYGVRGAAYATLLSQLVMSFFFWRIGSRLVRSPLEVGFLARQLLCGTLMGWAVGLICPSSVPLRIALRVLVGAGVYAALTVLVDSEVRSSMLRWCAARTRRSRRNPSCPT
jgi:O-antigen/teichoic acid export membrane protein